VEATDGVLELMLADFDAATKAAEAILRRLPPDCPAWRAHPRSRSIAEQAEHLIRLLGYATSLATATGHDLAKVNSAAHLEAFSPPDLLRRFQEATATTSGRLAALQEAELEVPWTLSRGGNPIVILSRRTALQVLLVNHLRHHSAQLELCLRLAGLPC
jgi:uncharacterized damage-inducible protein DinB